MPRLALLTLVLCASLPMLAEAPNNLTLSRVDSSVSCYGILDAGLAEVAHSLNFSSYHPVTVNPTLVGAASKPAIGMFNGGISQTRIGVKGGLDIGNGWKGVFTLESAINIPNGNLSNAAESLAMNTASGPAMSADSAISGQLFARAANFGLSSETYGTVTLGRHTTLMLDDIPAFDALQGAQLFTPIGFSGLYGGGGATDASRLDSSIKYGVKAGEFTLGALYKVGGAAGATSANSAAEVAVSYRHGGFKAMADYQTVTDATAIANPSGVVSATSNEPIGTIALTCEDTKATMLGLSYQYEHLSFYAGYQKLQYSNPSNPTQDAATTSLDGYVVGTTTTGGVTAPAVNVTPFKMSNGVVTEKDLTVTWLGAKYELSPKLSLAVSSYNVSQNDFSAGTSKATAKAGSTSYASALLDYVLARNFDAYVGYMGVKARGGMAPGDDYVFSTNSTFGVGLRYQF